MGVKYLKNIFLNTNQDENLANLKRIKRTIKIKVTGAINNKIKEKDLYKYDGFKFMKKF